MLLINLPIINDPCCPLLFVITGIALMSIISGVIIFKAGRKKDAIPFPLKRFTFRILNDSWIFLRSHALLLAVLLVITSGILYFLNLFVYQKKDYSTGSVFAFLTGAGGVAGLVFACNYLLSEIIPGILNLKAKVKYKDIKHIFWKCSLTGIIFSGALILLPAAVMLIAGVDSLKLFPAMIWGVGISGFLFALGGSFISQGTIAYAGLSRDSKDNPLQESYNQTASVLYCVGRKLGHCPGIMMNRFLNLVIIIFSSVLLGAVCITSPWFMESYKQFAPNFASSLALYPMLIMTAGLFAPIPGLWFAGRDLKTNDIMNSVKKGFWITQAVAAVLIFLSSIFFIIDPTRDSPDYRFPITALTGLLLGTLLTILFYQHSAEPEPLPGKTGDKNDPGMFRIILRQTSDSVKFCFLSLLFIVISILMVTLIFQGNISFTMYGIGILAVGTVCTCGFPGSIKILSTVINSAGCIARLPSVGKRDEENKELLDLDNFNEFIYRTGKITNFMAITGTLIAAIVFFALFASTSNILPSSMEIEQGKLLFGGETVNFTDFNYVELISAVGIQLNMPRILIALLLGASVPFIFISVMMGSVQRIILNPENIYSVYMNFNKSDENSKLPDHRKCLELLTHISQKEMLAPGLIVLCFPVIVGFSLGPAALGAFIIGAFPAGFLISMYYLSSGENSFYSDPGGENRESPDSSLISPKDFEIKLKELSALSISIFIISMDMLTILILPVLVELIGNPVADASFPGRSWNIRMPLILLGIVALGFAFNLQYKKDKSHKNVEE